VAGKEGEAANFSNARVPSILLGEGRLGYDSLDFIKEIALRSAFTGYLGTKWRFFIETNN
jgi:hypothetical protein